VTTWLVILVAALCTYLLRVSMVVALDRRPLPDRVANRLRLGAPAVLAAVVTASLFTSSHSLRAPAVGDLVAVVLAALVVRRTHNAAHALLVGLPVALLAAAVSS
jgi:branched-subunit amino acid transport protein